MISVKTFQDQLRLDGDPGDLPLSSFRIFRNVDVDKTTLKVVTREGFKKYTILGQLPSFDSDYIPYWLVQYDIGISEVIHCTMLIYRHTTLQTTWRIYSNAFFGGDKKDDTKWGLIYEETGANYCTPDAIAGRIRLALGNTKESRIFMPHGQRFYFFKNDPPSGGSFPTWDGNDFLIDLYSNSFDGGEWFYSAEEEQTKNTVSPIIPIGKNVGGNTVTKSHIYLDRRLYIDYDKQTNDSKFLAQLTSYGAGDLFYEGVLKSGEDKKQYEYAPLRKGEYTIFAAAFFDTNPPQVGAPFGLQKFIVSEDGYTRPSNVSEDFTDEHIYTFTNQVVSSSPSGGYASSDADVSKNGVKIAFIYNNECYVPDNIVIGTKAWLDLIAAGYTIRGSTFTYDTSLATTITVTMWDGQHWVAGTPSSVNLAAPSQVPYTFTNSKISPLTYTAQIIRANISTAKRIDFSLSLDPEKFNPRTTHFGIFLNQTTELAKEVGHRLIYKIPIRGVENETVYPLLTNTNNLSLDSYTNYWKFDNVTAGTGNVKLDMFIDSEMSKRNLGFWEVLASLGDKLFRPISHTENDINRKFGIMVTRKERMYVGLIDDDEGQELLGYTPISNGYGQLDVLFRPLLMYKGSGQANTWLTEWNDRILQFQRNNLWYTDVGDKPKFEYQFHTTGFGIGTHIIKSIAKNPRAVFWVNYDGIWRFDGGKPVDISLGRIHSYWKDNFTQNEKDLAEGYFNNKTNEYWIKIPRLKGSNAPILNNTHTPYGDTYNLSYPSSISTDKVQWYEIIIWDDNQDGLGFRTHRYGMDWPIVEPESFPVTLADNTWYVVSGAGTATISRSTGSITYDSGTIFKTLTGETFTARSNTTVKVGLTILSQYQIYKQLIFFADRNKDWVFVSSDNNLYFISGYIDGANVQGNVKSDSCSIHCVVGSQNFAKRDEYIIPNGVYVNGEQSYGTTYGSDFKVEAYRNGNPDDSPNVASGSLLVGSEYGITGNLIIKHGNIQYFTGDTFYATATTYATFVYPEGNDGKVVLLDREKVIIKANDPKKMRRLQRRRADSVQIVISWSYNGIADRPEIREFIFYHMFDKKSF